MLPVVVSFIAVCGMELMTCLRPTMLVAAPMCVSNVESTGCSIWMRFVPYA